MYLEFPNEDIMTLFEEEVEDEDGDKWIVWFDGTSNALGHGLWGLQGHKTDRVIDFKVNDGSLLVGLLWRLDL